ncbi:FecR domain-containing protein [Paenalcaligenes niemegkensis]|uniref:FecR domain-containing protein n=1 Tax=Paenalcaligenes niemegkensis TaxID=2895469 RepID=UPI001EE874D0|nr:FecR domain-containing protein [Paenalcaligenes niemegkensis]MCQ9617819.1 FecR domain-containing protein [Paenalcaligenes niemegkensis]
MLKRLTLYTLLTLALSSQHVIAQPSGAEGDDFIYQVQSGDTLSDIADLYTLRVANWRPLQALNNVADPFALPIGKSLHIPFSMIPMVPAETVVTHRIGNVQINGRQANIGYQLKEGDVVTTDASSFLALKLIDESTVSVPPNSQLTISRIRAFERAGITDSILILDKGNIETRVAPEQQGVGRFEVHTPVAITGVRGTDLRVRAQDEQTITEVITGRAKLHAPGNPARLVQANRGAAIDSTGNIYASTTLLPAPDISEPVRGPNGWQLSFPAVPGAESYLVQVSLDEPGSQLVSRDLSTDTTVNFRSSGSGNHYVRVRAIDVHGIMGVDAVAGFPGQASLTIADGTPVMTRFGAPVALTEF